jgi:hypothetical protein
MPSNRLALVSVAAGSALLGWATAGVTAIGADLPGKAPPAQTQPLDRPDHGHHHHHHKKPGV